MTDTIQPINTMKDEIAQIRLNISAHISRKNFRPQKSDLKDLVMLRGELRDATQFANLLLDEWIKRLV